MIRAHLLVNTSAAALFQFLFRKLDILLSLRDIPQLHALSSNKRMGRLLVYPILKRPTHVFGRPQLTPRLDSDFWPAPKRASVFHGN